MFDIIIIVMASFVCGYFIGRHYGQVAGQKEGENAAPLILRQRSYEKGYCLLCNRETQDTNSSVNDHILKIKNSA